LTATGAATGAAFLADLTPVFVIVVVVVVRIGHGLLKSIILFLSFELPIAFENGSISTGASKPKIIYSKLVRPVTCGSFKDHILLPFKLVIDVSAPPEDAFIIGRTSACVSNTADDLTCIF